MSIAAFLKCYYDQKSFLVFLHISKGLALNAKYSKNFVVISNGRLFILTPLFSFSGPPLLGAVLTDKHRGGGDVICSLA